MSLDFLLKGGFIIDGRSGNSFPVKGDIGIKSDLISVIGNNTVVDAEKVVDVSGLCICPGFIDAHSHSDFTLMADGRAEAKIAQGITTEINGNCGFSAAPLYNSALEQRIPELKDLDISERWNTLSEYSIIMKRRRFATNFFTLVGHGNLRASVVGYSDKALTLKDREKMFHLLRDSINAGASGLSTGLIYPPGIYTGTPEIVEVTRETARIGGTVYTTHMRSEDAELLNAVDEAIKIGFDSGIHVHISHLKTSGKRNWHKLDDVFKRIALAQQKGLVLTCDRYPYTASATGLDAVLPHWAFEGGREDELGRIKNERERLTNDMLRKYPEESCWEDIKIASVNTGKNRWMEGKSLSEIGRLQKKSPLASIFDILIEEDLRVDAIYFTMSEDNLQSILQRPYTAIGSDSSARSFNGVTCSGKPHPRGFGSFPRVLGKYVRETGIIPIKEAVYKMTGLPAGIFGLKDRGFIADKYFADITVFDPERISDTSSFDNPFKKPDGIHYVFVNGTPVLWEGRQTDALPGRILK